MSDGGEGQGNDSDPSVLTGKTRIFVGGLGGTVTSEDLRNTFASLGHIDSVDIIRTKGRSFAYFDFLPSSDKSLSKLFSTYNGCMWKGGRLRLEKANKHYLLRLRQEWREDAELANNSLNNATDATKSIIPPVKLNNAMNQKTKEFRLFFPKLRKLRPLPFSGTGKHKYSFQRVEVPALPTHFCDCEEHSFPSNTERENTIPVFQIQDGGIDEKELNIMESVMNKLFKSENHLKAVGSEPGLVEEREDVAVHDSEADHITEEDEDALVLNMVAGEKVQMAAVEGWSRQTILDDWGMAADGQQISKDRPSDNALESQRSKISSLDKKKKLPRTEATHCKVVPVEFESRSSVKKTCGMPLDDVVVGGSEADDMIDEDDDSFVMNMVARGKVGETTTEGQRRETILDNEERASDGFQMSKLRPLDNTPRGQRNKMSPPGRKRKSTHTEAVGSKVSSVDIGSKICSKRTRRHDSAHAVETGPALEEANIDTQVTSATDEVGSSTGVSNSNHVENQCKNKNQNALNFEPETSSAAAEEPRDDVTQLDKHNAASNRPPKKGALWAQKSSWMDLVGGTNASFSISQLLPYTSLEKEEKVEELESPFAASWTVREETEVLRKPIIGVSCGDGSSKVSSEVVKGKSAFGPGAYSIGETCSFMRSDSSMKEWKNAKAALSGSMKKKSNEKKKKVVL